MLGQLQDADIKLLRVFWVIAKHGSFHAAQTELNTSQATISTQVKQLETRLGRRLCHRGRAGFQLTDEGRSLLTCAERLFASISEFRNELLEAFSEVKGDLTLGIIDNLIHHPDWHLSEVLASYHQAAPAVQIKLHIHTPRELESHLLNSTLQFAIGGFPQQLPGLKYQLLFEEKQQLYCGAKHPLFNAKSSSITAQDLKQYDYFSWDYLEAGFSKTGKLFKTEQSGSAAVEAVAYALLSGQYLAYLPEHYAQAWVNQKQLRVILPDELGRHIPVMLVTRKTGRLPQLAEMFVERLIEGHGAE